MSEPKTEATPAVKAPITAAQYLAKPSTENQDLFLQWVLAETGVKFGSKAATDAFAQGVRAAGLYSKFQASKRPAATKTSK